MNSHSKVKKLLLVNQQKNMESIMVFVAAIFTYLLLPQLLIRYVYADQQLLEVPPALEYIPVGVFAIAIIHFIYVLLSNILRTKQITKLEQHSEKNSCCGGSCVCGSEDADMESMLDPEELAELERIVDEVLESPKKKKNTKAAAKKSAVKSKTASKKTSKKKSVAKK